MLGADGVSKAEILILKANKYCVYILFLRASSAGGVEGA